MKAAKSVVLLVDQRRERLVFFRQLFNRLSDIAFVEANNFDSALQQIRDHSPFLIVSNISLGAHDGIELLQEVRQIDDESYFVIYSMDPDEYLEATALEQGADDFFHEGVSTKVLQRKVENIVVRLRSYNQRDVLQQNGLRIDRDRYLVEKNGEHIVLPRKEFEMLYVLASRPEKVFRRDELTQLIWGKVENTKKSRTIDVHVRKLRTKIGKEYIKTVKGVGYRF
jgi:two-component system alkaline phosphatase synthesis response regulator PhoP